MINNNYIELPAEMFAEGKLLFQEGEECESLLFLEKYLRFIESDESCYNRLFLAEDPTDPSRKEKKILMFEFNLKVYRFLERLLKRSGKSVKKKPYSEGEVACFLGAAYEYGLFGIAKNSEMAFRHYTIAAQLKSALGTFRLAQCYERGFGTMKCVEKAVYFFRCSAKLGLLDGMHVYGTIIANGLFGNEPNPRLGLHFLSLAAMRAGREYPHALFDMGFWYEDTNKEQVIVPDPNYSLQLYIRGAELEEPNCQYRLSQVYEKGEFGEQRDPVRAVNYLRRAAQNGQVDAQIRLAQILCTGIPGKVPSAAKESFQWALMAATKRNARGAYIAGEYALKGFGTRRDILYAWWLFIISEKLGNTDAAPRVAELRRKILKLDEGRFQQRRCGFFCLDFC